jgi:hypothetical protein
MKVASLSSLSGSNSGGRRGFPASARSSPPMIGTLPGSQVPAAADCYLVRVGVLVCRWLFQTIHDTNAQSAFDYILPLMVCMFEYYG